MDDNKCCICGANYGRYGNNAEPVASGRCCNDCNAEVIIPARISMMFGAEENLKCDLCGETDLKRIENDKGQVFYYCMNEDSPSGECINQDYVGTSAEGKWIMPNGMHYNGVVKYLEQPDNVYLTNACPQCDQWFSVSDAHTWKHCDNCYDEDYDAEDDIILAQMYEIEDMENPSELDLKNYRNLEIKYDELTRMDAEDMQPLFDDLKKQATKFTGMTILFTGIAAIGGYLIGRNRA